MLAVTITGNELKQQRLKLEDLLSSKGACAKLCVERLGVCLARHLLPHGTERMVQTAFFLSSHRTSFPDPYQQRGFGEND